MKKPLFALLLSMILAITPAMALDAYGAHVTLVSGHDLPNIVYFQVDQPVDSCPAHAYLQYVGNTSDTATNQASIRAVYAMLLAAKVSGQTVSVFGTGSNVNNFCTIRGLQMA
jgi:hypothetical protein